MKGFIVFAAMHKIEEVAIASNASNKSNKFRFEFH